MRFTEAEIRKALMLYAVTDRSWLKEGESLIDICRLVLQNGATLLQLREKKLNKAAFTEEAREMKSLCAQFRVPLIVNDSVEIALEVNADGVHVGQSDIRGRDIRALIGKDKILGITARSVDEAVAAQKAGADYLGVGAVFGTSTKEDAKPMTLTRLHEICHAVTIPVVAIGGINANNISKLKGSGVAGAAVVSGIFAAEAPGTATAELLKLSQAMLQSKK